MFVVNSIAVSRLRHPIGDMSMSGAPVTVKVTLMVSTGVIGSFENTNTVALLTLVPRPHVEKSKVTIDVSLAGVVPVSGAKHIQSAQLPKVLTTRLSMAQ
jgi:hypothetical protein